MAISAPGGTPQVSFLRLPHPSGLAVDPRRRSRARREHPQPEPGRRARRWSTPAILPVASAAVPAADPLELPAGRALPARPRPGRRGPARQRGRAERGRRLARRRVRGGGFGGRAASRAPAGPTSRATTCSSTRSPPGRASRRSFFSASARRSPRRRPGHRNFPVDRARRRLLGRDPRAGRDRSDAAPLGAPARRGALASQTAATASSFGSSRASPSSWRGCPAGRAAFGWERGSRCVGTSRVIPRFRAYAPGLDVEASVCGVHADRPRERERARQPPLARGQPDLRHRGPSGGARGRLSVYSGPRPRPRRERRARAALRQLFDPRRSGDNPWIAAFVCS